MESKESNKSFSIDAGSTLTIRSLRITEEPIWIDVEEGKLAALELHASVKGWPANSRATALVILELADEVTQVALAQHGISCSAIGAYVYLDHHIENDTLHCSLTIPQGRLARIGFRLWSWKKEIFFENLCLTPRGGKLALRTASTAVTIFNNKDESIEDVLAVDLLDTREGCADLCAAKAKTWYSSMRAYQNKNPKADLGHTDCFFSIAQDEFAFVSAFHARPAMLEVPRSIDTYLQAIGDKSRNMVRKAIRTGYGYRRVDPNQYLDDVLTIRTSAPIRQGKEIPQYFRERPEFILPKQWCAYHGDEFYGVFKDDKLVAYITLYMYGQLAQVNHFLGHADHLKEGIMNLLMYEVVNDLIQNRPWVRAINYMYPGSATSASGTALFKRSMGFNPRRLLMAQHDPKLADVLEANRHQLAEVRSHQAQQQGSGRERIASRIDSAELGDTLVTRECATREETFDVLLHLAGEDTNAARCRFTFVPNEEQCAAPALLDAAVIVVDGVDAFNVVQFLSSGFKQFKKSVTKGSLVIFDFPSNPSIDHVPSESSTGDEPTSDVLKATIDYYQRRFKAPAPSPEAIRDGFKGSDFVLKAAVTHPQDGSASSTVLLLKKVR